MQNRMLITARQLSRMIIATILLLFVQPLLAASAASAHITLSPQTPHYTSAGALYYIEDPLGQWSLPYLLEQNIPLQPYPKAVFNEGFTASAYWLRLDVDGSQSPDEEWLLEINYPLLDVVNIYLLDKNNQLIREYPLGDLHPFADRPFTHRNFIVPLNFREHPWQRLLINVETSSSMQVPLNFWEVNHFVDQRSNEQYGLGLYYGMMLVIFLYNFFLWTSIRDTNYLHYIGYIAAFATLQLATSGLGYQFIWPDSAWFQQLAVPLTIGLVGVFGSTFTRGFLQTRINHRYADLALRFCLLLSAAICVSAFLFDTATVMSTGKFVVVIFLATVFYASISMLIKGQSQARYFLAAWVMLIIGGMITIGMMLGYLPNNMWTIHASKFGSSIEIVLLSFALADRIKILQRAKLQAEERVKKELEERAQRLAESNRLKNDFLATISHEFRTPLNGIIGSLELAGDEQGEALRATLQDARESAGDMLDLVDNVLTYTELQAGNRILAPETVELQPVIRSTSEAIQHKCREKQIGFELTFAPGLPSMIRADIKCIRHAIKALLENAVKFTEHGNVVMETGFGQLQGMPCLDILIRDTGIGMTAAELSRIQDYLCQGDTSMQRQYQGLGIGLSLVKAVCHCMQGEVTIHSEKHQGTRVRLKLPVQPLGTPDHSTLRQPEPSAGFVAIEHIRGRALVVEDNTVNQRVLNSMLNRMHIETDVADNGERALELLQSQRKYHYDLIFMDCQMPVMDGFEATRRIRAANLPESDRPVIAVTANAMSGDEQRCLDAGMSDYLSKPVSMESVRSMVHKWLPAAALTATDQPEASPLPPASPPHKPA